MLAAWVFQFIWDQVSKLLGKKDTAKQKAEEETAQVEMSLKEGRGKETDNMSEASTTAPSTPMATTPREGSEVRPTVAAGGGKSDRSED